MAIIPEQLFGPTVSQTPNLRAFPYQNGIAPGKLKQFGAAASLPNLTPLFFDDANLRWDVWVGQSNEVNTITANAAPATAGTFTLTVNGQTTAGIAFNANAAAVQAALEALSNVAPGDVVGVDSGPGANLGTGSHVVTLTWGGAYAGEDVVITANMAGLTGNPHVFATVTAGGSDASDGSKIDGFLWSPEAALAVSTVGELIIQIFRRGLIHRDDVPVPSGESQADLDQALLNSSLREKGIDVQGLANVH